MEKNCNALCCCCIMCIICIIIHLLLCMCSGASGTTFPLVLPGLTWADPPPVISYLLCVASHLSTKLNGADSPPTNFYKYVMQVSRLRDFYSYLMVCKFCSLK
jgi:hypothetical protein